MQNSVPLCSPFSSLSLTHQSNHTGRESNMETRGREREINGRRQIVAFVLIRWEEDMSTNRGDIHWGTLFFLQGRSRHSSLGLWKKSRTFVMCGLRKDKREGKREMELGLQKRAEQNINMKGDWEERNRELEEGIEWWDEITQNWKWWLASLKPCVYQLRHCFSTLAETQMTQRPCKSLKLDWISGIDLHWCLPSHGT